MILSKEIFRAYDIRGIIGETLTEEIASQIGKALGTNVLKQKEKCLAVGRDGRLSGLMLLNAFSEGVVSTGCNILDLGQIPTPVLYFVTKRLNVPSGVMITGSHNPKKYNGFKIVLGEQALYGDDILAILHQIQKKNFLEGDGVITRQDVKALYVNEIIQDITVHNPLKIVVDCGNGVSGVVAPRLYQSLGAEVVPLYCEVDGNFPNHHPDPGQPKNLQALIQAVKSHEADLGLAFDGDGDRLGLIDNQGNIIWPDRFLMLFVKDILKKYKGASIIYDVKCTNLLEKVISQAGGQPIISSTGHSLIKAKMKETGALLAGEMSGHVFIRDRWYGFDDALYTGARLLEMISQNITQQSSAEQFSMLPSNISTPEIMIEISEDRKFEVIEKLKKQSYFPKDAKLTLLDGIRVDFSDGWGLVRGSNTSACLILRFEATSQMRLEQIQKQFKEWLRAADPSLSIPF